jgi:hypothetical protein
MDRHIDALHIDPGGDLPEPDKRNNALPAQKHRHLKIAPAGVTKRIRVLTQPHRNDVVDYNGLLFRRDTIFGRPAQPAAYLPSVAGVTLASVRLL